MTLCPNCHEPMSSLALPAYDTTRGIEVDACGPCSLFWFDHQENVRLRPQAVLDLFRLVSASAKAPRRTLASSFNCPRCSRALAYSHDLQRTTRFTYWRCARDFGQLITYQQFLRAKNFVRTPSAGEIAKLRETIRQINCSQCGASIDLATDTACTHCGSPIALIDPDGVAKALADLSTEKAGATNADREAARAALTSAQIDAIFELHRMKDDGRERDLLAVGLAAVGGWLARQLAARE